MRKYFLSVMTWFLLVPVMSQTPAPGAWNEDMLPKLCELAQTVSGKDAYLYSEAFLHMAQVSGAIPAPGADGKFDTEALDKNVMRRYIADHFVRMVCTGGTHFLAAAYKTDNKDLLNDLLELSNLFYDGSKYEYWHFDFAAVPAPYDGAEVTDFTTYLQSQADNTVKRDAWIRAIDQQKVRTLKYVYETNSRDILIYLMTNESDVINRAMDYGTGSKNTFMGYVDGCAESDQKKEWAELLRTDPSRLKKDK